MRMKIWKDRKEGEQSKQVGWGENRRILSKFYRATRAHVANECGFTSSASHRCSSCLTVSIPFVEKLFPRQTHDKNFSYTHTTQNPMQGEILYTLKWRFRTNRLNCEPKYANKNA